MGFKVPITFLSATKPKRVYDEFVTKCGLPEHKFIRISSDRREHQYTALLISTDELITRSAAFIMKITSYLTGSRRGIIFTASKNHGHQLQTYLPDIDFIHGDVVEEPVRNRMIQKWKLGQSGGWLLGTSSLIQGVDYPDVHLVIFVGIPWGMIDFVQGAGRSGRNGEMSRVVVIHTGWTPKIEDEDFQCAAEMKKWLEGNKVCRRLGISSCMDDGNTTCTTLTGAWHCDICKPNALQKLIDGCVPPSLGKVIKFPPLQLPPSNGGPSRAPVQLEVPTIRPRLARLGVIRNSNKEAEEQKARISAAKLCISTLTSFGEKCIVCFFFNQDQDNTKHKMCLNNYSQEYKSLYDWSKPSHKSRKVRGCHIHTTRQLIDPLKEFRLVVRSSSSAWLVLSLRHSRNSDKGGGSKPPMERMPMERHHA